ncbi:unnamed protein product [Dracunculus medinensis]|uniref:Uncharacterized protein n=1 Tax=Dracunculus medinensis TaxID=318479 RepID=A0A3P7T3I4_DRAME|nr:unnamed protein product [Dracunculus medinensis]
MECYICGESNVEEFGECASQFPYDCSSYASRFEANERIFCRTTRQKTANNTYMIMKECISQKDHYRTFPKKDYPLDEECDLIDIQEVEVAYCLCRHNDLCNSHSIAEQFVAFQEVSRLLFMLSRSDFRIIRILNLGSYICGNIYIQFLYFTSIN